MATKKQKQTEVAAITSQQTPQARVTFQRYVQFRPRATWAAFAADRAERRTIQEWDAWVTGLLNAKA